MIRLLDLFSGAGGCARGYELAGFGEILGIDIRPQPRYRHEFIQADALDVLADPEFLRCFDLVHASPPCQGYSVTRFLAPGSRSWPLLIKPVREGLLAAGVPYVIENVEGARKHLREPVMCCGAGFSLRSYRHRLFECSFPVAEPFHPAHVWPQARGGRAPVGEEFVCVFGNASDVAASGRALGIDWMTGKELAQAIPPAFTRYIGCAFLNSQRSASWRPSGHEKLK